MPAIAALLLCLQFVPDQTPPPAGQPWPELPIRFQTLDNGLRIVAVEDPALDELSVQLWFRAGSALDPADAPGLMFVAWTLLEQCNSAAPRWRFDFARDACRIEQCLPRAELEAALTELSVWLRPLRVSDAAAGAAQRAAADRTDVEDALEAASLAARMPLLPAATRNVLPILQSEWNELLALALPDHPYAHPARSLGPRAAKADAQRMQELLNRWFTPSNATLFVIGNISAPPAIDAARTRLADLPWSPPPRRPELPRPPRESVRREATADGLFVAWVTPAWSYVENAAIDIVMQRLCNPLDGPLAITAGRLDLALAWDRFAWRDCGLVVLAVRPHRSTEWPQAAQQFQAALDPVLAALADEPWDPVALRRARTLAWRELLNLRSDPRLRAWRIAAHEMIGGDVFLSEYESSLLVNMPLGEVRRGVEALRSARRVILAPRPVGAAPPADGSSSVNWRGLAAGQGRLSSRPAGQPAVLGTEAQRAGGRLQIAVNRKPAAELVVLRIAFEPPGVANTIEEQLREARTPYTWPTLVDLSSYRGIEWRIDASEGTRQLEISAPADELAALIEIAAAVVLGLPHAAEVTQYRLTITAPQPPVEVLDLCDRFWTPRLKN